MADNLAVRVDESLQQTAPAVMRGSLIRLRRDDDSLALVVCNDIQCEASDTITVVPLERRRSRLMAPFAVDMGRTEGFRELYTARADWVTGVPKSEIRSIERAKMAPEIMQRVDKALKIALGIDF